MVNEVNTMAEELPPLQTDWYNGLLLIEAKGLTVISTLKGCPGQLPFVPETGVTR